jgi:hypothetical protein
MTKDKERDDALIAEVVETLRDVRDGVGCQPGYINTLGLRRIDAMLAKLQPAPKPDRAEVLARDVLLAWSGYQQLTDEEAGSEEFAKACRFTQTALDELRAEWEAERPAVVVPGEVLEQARANRYTPVGSVRIMARFILSLDGAKGDE